MVPEILLKDIEPGMEILILSEEPLRTERLTIMVEAVVGYSAGYDDHEVCVHLDGYNTKTNERVSLRYDAFRPGVDFYVLGGAK